MEGGDTMTENHSVVILENKLEWVQVLAKTLQPQDMV